MGGDTPNKMKTMLGHKIIVITVGNDNNWCMPLGSAWSNGAAGVHSCGILRRLEWRWGVVSYS